MVRWNSTLGYEETYNGAVWQPLGRVLQMVSGTIPAITGSTVITTAITAAPTTSDGILIWTQAFTPISASSRIVVSYGLNVAHGTAARTVITSVFAGATNIGSASTYLATINTPGSIAYQVVYSPGSIAAITFTARCGATAAGTIAVSQINSTTGTLGGAAATEYMITEIL
jgi:hypothetical protein